MVMWGGGVVGDVEVCCLCVFGIIILVLLDVFVVLQEKKEKSKCSVLWCMVFNHDWAS